MDMLIEPRLDIVEEINEMKAKKKLIYRKPLQTKKQILTKEESGKCKVFSEEDIFLYKIKKINIEFP